MPHGKISNCVHVSLLGDASWEELNQKHDNQECHTCHVRTQNLWLCLIGSCRYVGCGESVKDHSSEHAESNKHALTINLTTLRIWCYVCEEEVFPDRNNPPFVIPEKADQKLTTHPTRPDASPDSSPQRSTSGGDDSESDYDDETLRPKGLTGLGNLGNTCYINSALQALSNCPPLTRYFLDCQGFVRPEKSPMISKNYLKLMTEMWHKKRPSYLVPSGVVNGIKIVHPMFRGFAQQDTQEFLRCFMDQLHEELKRPVNKSYIPMEIDSENSSDDFSEMSDSVGHDRQPSVDSSSSASSNHTEGGYETCESVDKNNGNISMEECVGEVNETTKLNSSVEDDTKLKIGQKQTNKNNSLNYERVSTVIQSKEEKDHANLLSKHGNDTNSTSVHNNMSRSDSGEYVDAMADSSSHEKSPDRNNTSSPVLKNIPTPMKAAKGSKGSKKNIEYQSVISDIFDGKILSSVQCLTCERVSTTRETFQDISLPIPNKDHLNMIHSSQASGVRPGGACGEVHQGWISWVMTWMKSWFVGPTITLQDCLAAFFSADELKGDNMYSCEKCKKLRNGIKYSKVLQLPQILCIHLKRFRHEFYSSKIGTYVSFPLEGLDMSPYIHKDFKTDHMLYDLVAVICHHGTAGGGHYTAYCQNCVNLQWYEFDDQYVTEVESNQVADCEAYVLFYRKRNEELVKTRQRVMDLMDAREPSLMQFYVSKQWINRFNTFGDPGPITNTDFLCPHGGVPPGKVGHVDELVVPLAQSVWEYLYDKFEGGPVCNRLYTCTTCQKVLEQLRHRQKSEMEAFVKLNQEFQNEENPPIIYAISMSWFKEWENFVRSKTDSPPDAIDNSKIFYTKNGQQIVKQSSDYGQLSQLMWLFLYNIYGGGPELILRQNPVVKTLANQAGPPTLASQVPASSENPKSPVLREGDQTTSRSSEDTRL